MFYICRMVEPRKTTQGTRLTASERRRLRRAAHLLRIRESEFVRRAIARLVEETLAKKEEAA